MGWFDGEDDEDVAAAPPDQLPPPPAAAPQTGSLKDLLLQKYAAAGDPAALNQAKSNASLGHGLLAVGQAAENFARAPAIARGGPGANASTYLHAGQNLDQKVQQAAQERASAQESVLKEHMLGKQLDQEDVAQRHNDPNSQESQAFQGFLKKLYPDIEIPAMSYAEAKDKVPMLINSYETNATRRQNAADKLSSIEQQSKNRDATLTAAKIAADATRGARVAAKDEEDTNKGFDRFTDHLKGTVRDSIGAEKAKLRNTTHAQTILSQYKDADLDKLSPKQAMEVGAALAATLSQGHPAESTIHNMTPKSASSDLASALEYVTGTPQEGGLGAQLRLYKHMLERQADTSRNIIQGEMSPIVSNYARLRKKDPDRFDQIMAGAGLRADEKGNVVAYEPSYAKPAGKEPLEPTKDGQTAYAGGGKTAVKKEYSPSRGKTRITYSDGTQEVVDGQQ